MSDYMTAAETAKMIRKVLSESFPGVKFSVRSKTYSGGASINIRYTGGPANKLVESVVSVFEASYFDGMLDYQGSRYAKLDGKKIRFGADYISVNRHHTDAEVARAINGLRNKYPGNFARMEAEGADISVEAFNKGNLYRCNFYQNGNALDGSLQSMIHTRLAKMSTVAVPERSETLARIEFAGDDGYGAGTVGDLSKPESERRTSQGYPTQHAIAEHVAKQASKTVIPAPNVIAFPVKVIH